MKPSAVKERRTLKDNGQYTIILSVCQLYNRKHLLMQENCYLKMGKLKLTNSDLFVVHSLLASPNCVLI